jgi:hypothetical protein
MLPSPQLPFRELSKEQANFVITQGGKRRLRNRIASLQFYVGALAF